MEFCWFCFSPILGELAASCFGSAVFCPQLGRGPISRGVHPARRPRRATLGIWDPTAPNKSISIRRFMARFMAHFSDTTWLSAHLRTLTHHISSWRHTIFINVTG